jgi:uncharacterized coiled-coil DUF342 family protein
MSQTYSEASVCYQINEKLGERITQVVEQCNAKDKEINELTNELTQYHNTYSKPYLRYESYKARINELETKCKNCTPRYCHKQDIIKEFNIVKSGSTSDNLAAIPSSEIMHFLVSQLRKLNATNS